MKRDFLASISDTGNGTKRRIAAAVLILLTLVVSQNQNASGNRSLTGKIIENVYLTFSNPTASNVTKPYYQMLHIKKGDPFHYKAVRKTMETLYNTGSFDNVEVKVKETETGTLEVFFQLSNKYLLKEIEIKRLKPFKVPDLIALFSYSDTDINKNELKKSIFSLQRDSYFDEKKLEAGLEELKQYLNSRGYFNPSVSHKVTRNESNFTAFIKFYIKAGIQTKIDRLELTVTRQDLLPKINKMLKAELYIPHRFNQKISRAKEFLVKENYFFPDIKVREEFSGPSKSSVTLRVTIDPGYKYLFNFDGMKRKLNLVSSIWKNKVFEKWAEGESNKRILYYLKNKGYLDARVESNIQVQDSLKIISFKVTKNKKYRLGKIYFEGNKAVSTDQLRRIIQLDDLVYEKFFHLRLSSILVDRAMIRLYYQLHGYPSTTISTEPVFRKNSRRADIRFVIKEGKKYTVDSILFEGNHFFTAQTLSAKIKTHANLPFVEQTVNEDIEKLRVLYHTYGFDKIDISPEISQGTQKAIFIRIKEGKAFRMGQLIIIGASSEQRKLLKKLFPLKKDAPFNQLEIDVFTREIENSSLFTQFKLIKIERDPDILDLLIKVNPDYSKYYGFGLGWEERKNFRGTLEYQGRNIFNSYSTFSALLQAGPFEMRGVLTYDTPYFFKTRLSSALKIWADDETYPSYRFNRFGISESLIKRLKSTTYVMGSISWYRTRLKELEIAPMGIDQTGNHFDTAALSLSYVAEKRDDPFNPKKGTFFSSELKLGILHPSVPLPSIDKAFIKLRWSYQKNLKFLKNGILSMSVRNGLAYGELSITERFFAGGPHSFRGVRTDRLGPRDDEYGNPMGGNAMVLFNVEATFPLLVLPVDDLYYSIYTDIGNVFRKPHHLRLNELKTTIGLSLKWKMPLGLLWGGLAWNMNPDPGRGSVLVVVGIGNVF
jgi:outer membrane protein insertion porin family